MAITEIPTPAALVDTTRMQRNINTMQAIRLNAATRSARPAWRDSLDAETGRSALGPVQQQSTLKRHALF